MKSSSSLSLSVIPANFFLSSSSPTRSSSSPSSNSSSVPTSDFSGSAFLAFFVFVGLSFLPFFRPALALTSLSESESALASSPLSSLPFDFFGVLCKGITCYID